MLDVPPRRFPIAFTPPFQAASLLAGVLPSRAWVELRDGRLTARFGPWVVSTPISNVASVEITGPYAWPKVIGTPHLSASDGGVTFAGNARRGVCLRFSEPVAGIDPLGLLRHPGLTVTVGDTAGLVRALEEHLGAAQEAGHATVHRLPTTYARVEVDDRPTDAEAVTASTPAKRAAPRRDTAEQVAPRRAAGGATDDRSVRATTGGPPRSRPTTRARAGTTTRRSPAKRSAPKRSSARRPAAERAPAPEDDTTSRPPRHGVDRQAEVRRRLAMRTVVELRALGRDHAIDLRGARRKADLVLVLARDLPEEALEG